MRIIGFAGLARAGKTTAKQVTAQLIIDEHSELFFPASLSFADPIRDGLAEFGVTKEGTPELYRGAAQEIGAWFRDPESVPGKTGQGYWKSQAVIELMKVQQIEKAEYQLCEDAEQDEVWREYVVIMDDVRYPNEVEMIQSYGGSVIFIDASRRLDLDSEIYQHESEELAMAFTLGMPMGCEFNDQISNNEDAEGYPRRIREVVKGYLNES